MQEGSQGGKGSHAAEREAALRVLPARPQDEPDLASDEAHTQLYELLVDAISNLDEVPGASDRD